MIWREQIEAKMDVTVKSAGARLVATAPIEFRCIDRWDVDGTDARNGIKELY
jgi:hypothetical protein